MSAALLPPVPALPHDPLSLVLDARVGWRLDTAATGAEVAALDGALVLAPLPGAARSLADPYGSFGGLVLPANVAWSGETLVLLDRAALVLRRFDPCGCRFLALPCIAGAGGGPRQLGATGGPGGMAVAGGNLYLCDAGNRRVQVFGLRGLVLRALWTSPAEAGLAQPWRPVAVVADPRGHILVGDPNNGRVHRFHASGRWLGSIDGLGAVEHLTVDRDGRLYVQVQGDPAVHVFDAGTGRELERIERADQVAARFAPLPVVVTAEGHLRLGALCQARGVAPAGSGDFDASGAPVEPTPSAEAALFPTTGQVLTLALDSATHRCTWDRLAFEGDFPAGSSVRASVYTAETELPIELIRTLPADAWSPCPMLDGGSAEGAVWDCLLRAPAGRFLWLRLELGGDGHVTPRIHGARLWFPRVSLRRYLPGVFGADPVSAEFTDRFLGIFDRGLREIEGAIDDQASLYDPLSSPTGGGDPRRDFLSWLAGWLGISLDRSWPEERRRRYLKQVGSLLPLRGTLDGLRRHLQLYLGLDAFTPTRRPPCCGPCTTDEPPRWRPPELVLEHFRLRRWLFVNHGRLGVEARLWGERIVNRSRLGGEERGRGTARADVSRLDTTQDPFRDPFHVYAHKVSVFVPASLLRSTGARRGLERLLRAERPAHSTCQVVYVEPRFRIGVQSMIGFDTAIGRTPVGGVTLGETLLGKASVVDAGAAGDALAVGKTARVGTTTRLH